GPRTALLGENSSCSSFRPGCSRRSKRSFSLYNGGCQGECVTYRSGLLKTVVAIAGPTGAGKSELALRVAEEFDGEVVNCDSLQVYRYFDIGTAKLTPAEMRGVPHHLIGILDPDQIFTAGE